MREPALAGMADVLHRATSRFRPGDTFDGNFDGVQSASADGVACGPSNPACPAPIVVGKADRMGEGVLVGIVHPTFQAPLVAVAAGEVRRRDHLERYCSGLASNDCLHPTAQK